MPDIRSSARRIVRSTSTGVDPAAGPTPLCCQGITRRNAGLGAPRRTTRVAAPRACCGMGHSALNSGPPTKLPCVDAEFASRRRGSTMSAAAYSEKRSTAAWEATTGLGHVAPGHGDSSVPHRRISPCRADALAPRTIMEGAGPPGVIAAFGAAERRAHLGEPHGAVSQLREDLRGEHDQRRSVPSSSTVRPSAGHGGAAARCAVRDLGDR